MLDKINDCFATALREEQKGMKHKGLLIVKPNREEAKSFIVKAKQNLELCYFIKEKGFEYKLPEEWFYTLYYCALAILVIFGVESRSQRCTGLFLKYLKQKSLIDYEDDFIERIQVYKEKGESSDVDTREKGRYSSEIHLEGVIVQYQHMMNLCKRAISQCEEIVLSHQAHTLPLELQKFMR